MRTSRIGRKPINIPSGTDIKIIDGIFTVKGPKGSLSINVHPFIHVATQDGAITIRPVSLNDLSVTGAAKKLYRSIAGTLRANIASLIHGVTQGFEKKLVLIGVGYRAQAKGKVLSLSLGYSHPTDFTLPEGVLVETPTQTEIVIKGASKELVGQVAATIRAIRSPEPYKGKGIRYANEVIELKETKKK